MACGRKVFRQATRPTGRGSFHKPAHQGPLATIPAVKTEDHSRTNWNFKQNTKNSFFHILSTQEQSLKPF